MRLQVKDFMSSPVTTTVKENSIKEVRILMKNKGIHTIPIVEYSTQLPSPYNKIQGIVTGTDLNTGIDEKFPVSEIMTSQVHIVHKNSSAQAAAKMMLKHKVHHIVVMDDGKIVGIISSLDFVGLVAEYTLD